MSQINPFVGSILQSSAMQRQQATQKDRQARHIQEMEKNIAVRDDELEHAVESSEELRPAQEHRDQDPRQKKRDPRDQYSKDDKPHLDLIA